MFRRKARAGVTSGSVESFAKTKSKRVRFDLREFKKGPSQREVAEADVQSRTGRQSSEELRHENQEEPAKNTRPNRDAVSKSTSTGASTGRHASSISLLSPQRIQLAPANIGRSGASFDSGTDTFVRYKWGHYESAIDKPTAAIVEKRVHTKRNVTNINSLGNAYAAMDEDDDGDPDGEQPDLATEMDQETAPESSNEAARDNRWVQSMKNEIKALKNKRVWRVVPTPQGVRLIKSKYVYRVKKDWTSKVIKRKSRLIVQGFSQREGVDYDETFAPVAKVTTFRLMLALSKVLNLEIHQLDVDSALLYADLEQAPRNWNKNIVDHIKSIGFTQSILDNCLFVKTVLRVLVYLRGTPEVRLRYTGDDLKVYAYSDADWAGDLDSRKSTTEYVVYTAGGPIAWESKLQTTIAVSTMEAEYMASLVLSRSYYGSRGCWAKSVSTLLVR